jgi:hypothetical protein
MEKRHDLRQPFPSTIKYSLKPHSPREICTGIVTNICSRGLSLNIFRRLCRGEEITIESELPNGCKKAIVRWIKKMDKDMYKVGLECYDS